MIIRQLRLSGSSPDKFPVIMAIVRNFLHSPDLLKGEILPDTRVNQIHVLQQVADHTFCRTIEAESYF